MTSRPKILVFGFELRWLGPARLPRALQAAGFEVGIAGRPRALSALTCFRDHFFPLPENFSGPKHFSVLQSIINTWHPDLILPSDDTAALFLSSAHFQAARLGDQPLAKILEHSLGNPAAIQQAGSKRLTMDTARALVLRVPASQTIASRADLTKFIARQGFPLVLKNSFGCSGKSVFICPDAAAADAAWQRLRQHQRWEREFQARLRQLRERQFSRRWLPVDLTCTASQYIPGRCASSLAAVGGGAVLGLLTSMNEETFPDEQSPASVVRFIRHEEMRATTAQLVKHWGLTGLIGFDFQIDHAGNAWLLECNPRPTPIAHLGKLVGEDLCLALRNWVSAAPLPRGEHKDNFLVAHFPQELWRDPQSAHLQSAFHDVPLDDLKLLAEIQQTDPPRRPALAR